MRVDEVSTSAGLSKREREVVDLLLIGRSAAEIAGALGISPATVKFHQTNALVKLGVSSRNDLVRALM